MSMKNSSDTIGNRSRDLPVCSAVPQPLRHRVPRIFQVIVLFKHCYCCYYPRVAISSKLRLRETIMITDIVHFSYIQLFDLIICFTCVVNVRMD
jgi:hypothetical protein